MRHRDPSGQRPGTERYRPTASVRHTWWGVTAPRRTRTRSRRTWVGILAVAALAVAFPVLLWLVTEPLVAAGLLVAAVAALTGRWLGVSADHPTAASEPDPPVAPPADQ